MAKHLLCSDGARLTPQSQAGRGRSDPLQARPHRAQNQAGDTDTNIDPRRKLLLFLHCEESLCPRGYLGGEVLSLLFNATKYVLKWIPSLPLSNRSHGYSLGEMVNLIILASMALGIQLGARVTGKLNPSQIFVPVGISKTSITWEQGMDENLMCVNRVYEPTLFIGMNNS